MSSAPGAELGIVIYFDRRLVKYGGNSPQDPERCVKRVRHADGDFTSGFDVFMNEETMDDVVKGRVTE